MWLCYGIADVRTSTLCDSKRMQQQISKLVLITLAFTTLMKKAVSSIPPTALTNVERGTFLTEHNHWRSLVRPLAGDMFKMVYNDSFSLICGFKCG